MRIGTFIAAALLLLGPALSAWAQEDNKAEKPASVGGPKLGEPVVRKWKIGMIASSSGGAIGRLTGRPPCP